MNSTMVRNVSLSPVSFRASRRDFSAVRLLVGSAIILLVTIAGVMRDVENSRVSAWTSGITNLSLLTGSGTDIGRAIAVASDGSVYVAGFYTSPNLTVTSSTQVVHSVTNSGAAGTREAFLAKFDSDGEPVWLWSFGGAGDDYAEALAVDSNDRIYVGGYFSGTATFRATSPSVVGTSAGMSDGFVARLSAAGDLQWATTFGGTGEDRLNDLAVAPDGSIVVGGSVTGSVGVGTLASTSTWGDTTEPDGLVTSFSPTGTAMWSVRVGGSGKDHVYRVAVGAQGSVLVAGTVSGSASMEATDGSTALTPDRGNSDAFVATLGASGSTANGWTHRFGGSGIDEALGLGVDAQGNASVASTVTGDVTVGAESYLAGTGNDILVVQFDSAGQLRWGNRVDSGATHDEPRHLAVAPSGQVVTAGRFGSDGASHLLAVAHDINGGVVWGPTLVGDSSRNQIGQSVAVDAVGNVMLTGRFAGGRIDQADASTDIAVVGASDVMVLKYSLVFPQLQVTSPPVTESAPSVTADATVPAESVAPQSLVSAPASSVSSSTTTPDQLVSPSRLPDAGRNVSLGVSILLLCLGLFVLIVSRRQFSQTD
jgi:hypothetical protein